MFTKIGRFLKVVGFVLCCGVLGWAAWFMYSFSHSSYATEANKYDQEEFKKELVERSPFVGKFNFSATVLKQPESLSGRSESGKPKKLSVPGFSLALVKRTEDNRIFRCLIRDDFPVKPGDQVEVLSATWCDNERGNESMIFLAEPHPKK